MPSTMNTIIAMLSERLSGDGSWRVTTEELESLVDPVDLYRTVFELGQIGRDVYSAESSGELVNLLEKLVASDAEEQLRRAGLFLSHEDRLEITDRLVQTVRRAVVVHIPEPETFRAMLRQARRYDLAEELYCSTFLDLEQLARECAHDYADVRGGSDTRYYTTLWYTRTLVRRRIVTLGDLAPSLFDLLRTVARQEGALPPLSGRSGREGPGDAGDRRRDSTVPSGDRRRWALGVLHIASPDPGRNEIQQHYRSMMRRYHPDVNPDGLDMAKQINTAYALLLSDKG